MKIAIDIRAALGKRLGKGVYTYNLVRELLLLDRENEYLLLADRGFSEEGGELCGGDGLHGGKITWWKGKPGALWHLRAKKKIMAEKCDVFFAPTSFIVPALLPSTVRSIIVVHDLVAFLFPRKHQIKATLIEKTFLKRALKKAAHIVIVSENTKRDLLKLFPFCSGKPVTVIYPAACHCTGHLGSDITLPKQFFLTVGALEPRKNLEAVLDAHERLRNEMGENIPSLVVVGSEGWKNKKLMKKLSVSSNILLLPYLTEAALARLYQKAFAFIFPSLYEGFGMPPLEAMAAGAPVICSNAASLPEVCGDAALFFNPKDATTLTEHMKKIIADATLRKELSQKGFAQAKKFSWQKSAEKLLVLFHAL